MLLNEQAFYVFPRLNPDGAEYSLAHPFRWCGNGRFVPGTEDERTRGLYQTDLNNDGYIVQMRVPDPAGEWKVSEKDSRVMVQRDPGEFGGQYYRLYPEGLIPDYDGVELEIEPTRDGNLNRQFPAGWMPETVQYGAGLYPGSEPESKALIDFILSHPNICGMNSFHTHGGVHLRPSTTKYDHEMSPRDLTLFKDLAAVALKTTGYKTISSFQDFTPDKTKPRRGTLKDWAFEEMGIPALATELWDIEVAAGIEKVAFYNLRPGGRGLFGANGAVGLGAPRPQGLARVGAVRPPATGQGRNRRAGRNLGAAEPAGAYARGDLPQEHPVLFGARRQQPPPAGALVQG